MPAPVLPADKRPSQLLTVLFWIGVGLAPVAALILLVADGNGPLRFAAVLAILSVVLIGLSIAMRADGDGGAARTEELLDEIEQLRRELRGEIVAAAQRGNQALDQSQRAQEQVAGLRRRLDAAAAAAGSAADDPASAGRARVPAVDAPEEIPAGRFTTSDEPASGWGRAEWQDEDEPPRRPQPAARYGGERPSSGHAGVYGADRSGYAADHPAQPAGYGDRPAQPAGYGDRPAQPAGYGAERPVAGQAGVYGAAPRPPEHDSRPAAPGPEHAPRPVGTVRHTETVHVTTRHTIVDGPGADPAGANLYGGGYAGRWSPTAPAPEDRAWGGHAPGERSWGSHGPEPEEASRPGYAGSDDRARPADDRSWDGQRDDRGWSAGRDDRAWSGSGGQDDDRAWSGGPDDDRAWSGAGDQSWGAPAEQPARGAARPDDVDGDYWSELRAGNRWAAVRDDERGREVRVGERRAAAHADGTGTEYRVEDRWAAVRQGEPRRGPDRGGDDGWRGDRAEESRPALPVGGVPVPDEWRPPAQRNHRSTGEWRAAEPEPDRLSRHQRADEERYGYPPRDEVPRAGGAWR